MATQTDYVSTLFSNIDDPNKITVALTAAVKALEQGYSASIMLMVDGVYLARPGTLDGVDIGAPFMPAPDLLAAFMEKGGQMLVCGACMQHNGVPADEIDSRFEVITADDVVSLLMGAKGTLQLT